MTCTEPSLANRAVVDSGVTETEVGVTAGCSGVFVVDDGVVAGFSPVVEGRKVVKLAFRLAASLFDCVVLSDPLVEVSTVSA